MRVSHVFISYIRENEEQVLKLCNDLGKHGVNVWLDRNKIKPGFRWKDAVREAIREGDFFIACFSKEYSSRHKTFMNEELILAIEELRLHHTDRIWLIPVLLSECDVPIRTIGAGQTLLDIQWVPLYEDWDAGVKQIISVINPIPQNIQILISALSSNNYEVRESAVDALARMGEEATAAECVLIKIAEDDYPRIRSKAIEVLGNIRSRAAIPTLINTVKNKDEYVMNNAIDSLSRIGEPGVLPLIGLIRDESSTFRGKAYEALSSVTDSYAINVLIRALKDDSSKVRIAAIRSLNKIGDSRAIPSLVLKQARFKKPRLSP